MKKEVWSIVNNTLVVNYETYTGKKGTKTFTPFRKDKEGRLSFKEIGTNYALSTFSYSNFAKCFTPLYNNTKLNAFIDLDLNTISF